jgi:phosphotransferase system enzyme I (PtsP)
LIALGYRSLSLSASAVGPVKALILDLDARKAEGLLCPLVRDRVSSGSLRGKLESFAAAEGLQL